MKENKHSPHVDRRDTTPPPAPVVRRSLNVPLLIGTLLAILALGVVLYSWHSVQYQKAAEVLLARARSFEEQHDFSAAADYLFRYTRLQPEDATSVMQLAKVYEQSVKNGEQLTRAAALYYKAIGVAPPDEQPALERSLIQILLRAGRFDEAEAEAKKLLGAQLDPRPTGNAPTQSDSLRVDGARLLALALYGKYRSFTDRSSAGDLSETEDKSSRPSNELLGPEVVESLRRALALRLDPELATILAVIYREETLLPIWSIDLPSAERADNNVLSQADRLQTADQLMDEMVSANADDAIARLRRFMYRSKYALPGAADDLQEALRIGGNLVAVRLAAARFEHQQATAIIAQQQEAPERHDHVPAPHTPPATIPLAAQQHLQAAADHCQFVLNEIDADNVEAFVGWGDALAAMDRLPEAVLIYRRGLDAVTSGSLVIDWHLAAALLAGDDVTDVDAVLQRIEDQLASLAPRVEPSQLAGLRRSLSLMQAKTQLRQGQTAEALVKLNNVVSAAGSTEPEHAEKYQALLLLGDCYQELGQWDKAATSYEDAATIHSQDPAACAMAALAWQNSGALDRAVTLYRRAAHLGSRAPTLVNFARALLARQQLIVPSGRDWREFESVLSKARSAAAAESSDELWMCDLLEAEYLSGRSADAAQRTEDLAKALEIVRTVERQHADSPTAIEQLVRLYEKLGNSTDADRVAQSLASAADDGVQLCLLRAQQLINRRAFDEARDLLEQQLPHAREGDLHTLQKSRVRLALDQGDYSTANRILEQLWELHPDDATIAMMREESALSQDDFATARIWESRLVQNFPAQQTTTDCLKVQRLLAESAHNISTDGKARLQEAEQILNQLVVDRPNWSLVYLLQGKLEQQRARFAQAAEAYQRAHQLGDRRLAVYEGLVACLYHEREFKRAEAYLAELGDTVMSSSKLAGMAINVALELDAPQRAVALAQHAVNQRPDDIMARIWYGQLLISVNEREEGETVLRTATHMAPSDVRTWSALFAAYSRLGMIEEARKTLQDLEKKAELTDSQRAFVLAQSYEQLSDHPRAETYYRRAVEGDPTNIPMKLRLAAFWQPEQPEQALQLLEHVLRLDPDQREARRRLAALLAAQGGDVQWRRACQLLAHDSNSSGIEVADRRLQAVLLVNRDGAENMALARELLEQLVSADEAIPADRLLLARLLEQGADVRGAREQYRALVAADTPDVQSVSAYVDFLLRHNDVNAATHWLKVLQMRSAGGFDLGLLRLQSRWLFAQGKGSEIVALVDGPARQQLTTLPAGDVEGKTRFLKAVATLLSECRQESAAEQWYRRLHDVDSLEFTPLALCLARQGRVEEAITMCLEAATKSDTAVPVVAVATVLAVGGAPSEQSARAELLLQEAEQQFAHSAEVLLALSNARIVQNRFPDAIRLLQRTVELDPDNVVALNNLATIMSEQPALRRKAIEYIDRAIAITGPRADVYDTKGTIEVHDGNAEEAVPLLEFAVNSAAPDPRYRFHLAAAYFRAGERELAAEHLKKSLSGRLEEQYLTQQDRQLLSEMQSSLE